MKAKFFMAIAMVFASLLIISSKASAQRPSLNSIQTQIDEIQSTLNTQDCPCWSKRQLLEKIYERPWQTAVIDGSGGTYAITPFVCEQGYYPGPFDLTDDYRHFAVLTILPEFVETGQSFMPFSIGVTFDNRDPAGIEEKRCWFGDEVYYFPGSFQENAISSQKCHFELKSVMQSLPECHPAIPSFLIQ